MEIIGEEIFVHLSCIKQKRGKDKQFERFRRSRYRERERERERGHMAIVKESFSRDLPQGFKDG
jgi:hypothetical protein